MLGLRGLESSFFMILLVYSSVAHLPADAVKLSMEGGPRVPRAYGSQSISPLSMACSSGVKIFQAATSSEIDKGTQTHSATCFKQLRSLLP